MNRVEKTKEGKDILFDNKEQILASKKLFEIHKLDPSLSPEDAMIRERTIVGNFNYLTENRKMSKDEYFKLFQRCEDNQNFAELALITRDFLIERAEQYLKDNPNLPEDGDAINPGKGNIRTGIMWNAGGKESISDRSKKGIKIAIFEISGPALREVPDWMLVIRQNEIRMSEVYAMLEEDAGNKPEQPPTDEIVANGVVVTHGQVEVFIPTDKT